MMMRTVQPALTMSECMLHDISSLYANIMYTEMLLFCGNTSKHGTIADDLNGWSSTVRTQLLSDLASSFPCACFEYLSKRELLN
jgi:hypothetical protein